METKNMAEQQEPKPVKVKEVYELDLDIKLNISSKNGAHSTRLESELSTPFTLILFALNQVTDSLNKLAQGKTQEELLRMSLRDVIAPPPAQQVPQVQTQENEQV